MRRFRLVFAVVAGALLKVYVNSAAYTDYPPYTDYPHQSALERNHWCRSRAAQDLGFSRVTLWRRMWKYDLHP